MKNIFVGNLDFRATEASVRSWFEEYGAVERVSIVTDRDTGRSRGFAFVEMTNGDEADRAIGASGRVVGIADPEALANAAVELLGDEQAWHAAQVAAIKRVETYYTLEMMIGQYRDVYQRAMAQ